MAILQPEIDTAVNYFASVYIASVLVISLVCQPSVFMCEGYMVVMFVCVCVHVCLLSHISEVVYYTLWQSAFKQKDSDIE